MPIKTGYKKADLAAQAGRIKTQADALVAGLPRQPLQGLELVCGCDRCIDPPVYDHLIRTPAPQFTTRMVGQYFGGAGAVPIDIGEREHREARVFFTHVLAHLGEAVCRSREEERNYFRTDYHIEPAYWIENLIKTGFLDTLAHEVKAQMRVYLMEVTTYAAATGSARFNDALTYLAMATDALPQLLENLRNGLPRKHLVFWATLAGGGVSTHPSRRNPSGADLYLTFHAMPERGVEALMLALDDPQTERMMERYALAAKDQAWLTYLSRLMQWREATLSRSSLSDRKRP